MGCCGAATRVESLGKDGAPVELPCKDRSVRDLPCLVIFIVFLVGGILGMCVVLSEGTLKRIINGYDNYGNVCGMKNKPIDKVSESGRDYSNKGILQISTPLGALDLTRATADFGPNPFHLSNRTCSDKCPSDRGERIINYCFLSGSASSESSGNSSDTSVSSTDFMGASSLFEGISRDLQAAWPELVGICAIALALSVVLLVILRFLAWLIVYLVVVIVILGALAATGFLWYQHIDYKNEAEKSSSVTIKNIRNSQAQAFLIYAIIASILTLLLLIVLFIMRKRIKLVTALFKEAGKAIQAMPFLLLQPLITFLVLTITLCVWVVVALGIESMGTPVPGKDSGFVSFHATSTMGFFRWYNLFALFWISQFILSCQDMVVGGAISKWFFTRDKSKLGSPILLAIKNTLFYHLGSVALGSFIIAVVKMIRFILKRLQKRMGQNPAIKAVCCCCQCCIWLLEKFLKVLNRNAYVEIAIHGYCFCKAAQQAFGIMARNALRVAAINSIGDFVLFLGKAAVTVSTVFIGLEIMKGRPDVPGKYVVVAIGGVFAYIISYTFISIYEMAIDALFICFCEDCELNDGVSKPYYMSKGLMELVQNSKKALAELKNKQEKKPPSAQPMFVRTAQ
ncbi:choline transporter-like protein 1 [Amphibalanus amphitrite]|uniref:choline transporter-like protein 1 n=1 Tax=Amphibalanus amphitrite TaxID=1232801 RepID=UPI001C90D974|nr:choline transporter-like protein 1 [Amphibalanus amphitrite]